MRTDPRLRQTWDQFSQHLESANQSAQNSLFAFSQGYLNPCLSSVAACLNTCTAPCFPDREDRHRRSRGRVRSSRAEYSFDFYDDWDEDDSASAGLLGWGNDELDRLLAGSGATSNAGGGPSPSSSAGGTQQPGRRPRAMSYGSRGHRKTAVPPHDGGPDPTVIPSTSAFGFLSRLPWRIAGGKGLRYKPSVADLQERHPEQAPPHTPFEAEPLLEEPDETQPAKPSKRPRSSTTDSGSPSTSESIRSRADLFPSDSEADDDAVPLDDSFAMVLERRTTGSHHTDDHRSSRASASSGEKPDAPTDRPPAAAAADEAGPAPPSSDAPPSMTDLKHEEERIRREEERDVAKKRDAARRLAEERGLATSPQSGLSSVHTPAAEDAEEEEESAARPRSPPHWDDEAPRKGSHSDDAQEETSPDPPPPDPT
ncbi:MAG: hypothetical protein M1833_001298 [Piccolia ochrophora]|nr:MAG: hypothetical protein M1833_001298 [Piccolia ochrophora]